MIRPLLGQPIIGTSISTATRKEPEWSVYPNPATGRVSVRVDGIKDARCEILDAQGRVIMSAAGQSAQELDISRVAPGIYFVRIISGGQVSAPKKIIKL
jgi:hypothetical protein